MSPMHVDAFSLITMALCSIILVCHDRTLSFFGRFAVCFAGAMCFAQSMWLLGVWVPGNAGYPWPRVTLDTALAVAAVTRAHLVLIEHYARRVPRVPHIA